MIYRIELKSWKKGLKLCCPECKEKMQKKEGKEYYMCKKHWGYPDMIEK
ncbi:hypothetical protein LCGC14_1740140, partial [marine sediment metagenome]